MATCSCETDKLCLPCKLRYWRTEGELYLSNAATPTRRSHRVSAPPNPGNNSYEAGIPRDERGMPWLDTKTLEPMGQKEVDQKRHLIEDNKRKHQTVRAD